MELQSQQAELLRILFEQGIHLTTDDFKPAQSLAWFKKAPRFVAKTWNSVVKNLNGATALEEPSTGYFYAAVFNTKTNSWVITCSPGEGTPQPKTLTARANQLDTEFRRWATRLKTELESKNRWPEQCGPGETPLTLGKLDSLSESLDKTGLGTANLTAKNVNGDTVQIIFADQGFSFSISPGWKVRYRPGQFTKSSTFTFPGWSAVLEALFAWATYVKRESNVEFPSIEEPVEQPQKKRWTLLSLRLENIRRFIDFELEFHPKLNLFCGVNGTGKSTILRCISIALAHGSDQAAMLSDVPGDLLASTKPTGSIQLTASDLEGKLKTFEVNIKRQVDRDALIPGKEVADHQESFICGYGSIFGLKGEQSPSEYSIRDSTKSLFDYRTELFGLETVLRRLKDRADETGYEERVQSLCQAIGLEGRLEVQSGGGVVIVDGENRVPFEGLADGYRVSLSWIVDLFGWALLSESLNEGLPDGVLLVDEVDKHMHPALQANLINNLEQALPKMQMFLSTHNPLTVLGTPPASLIVLKPQGGKVVRSESPNYSGYSVEDIYVDPKLFATEPFAPEVSDLLSQHRLLARIPVGERTPEQNEKLRSIALELRRKPERDQD